MTLALIFVQGSADTLAPVLDSPSATATGPLTASGSVNTTNDANGTLYFWATQNATETVADIKANGSSQAVAAEGQQNVTVSGLTQATTYYLHFVHTDAASNDSLRATSTSFTTTEGAAGSSHKRKKRESLDELRRASQAAILRRRKREELDAQVRAIQDREIPKGKTLEYSPQAHRIAAVKDPELQELATRLAVEFAAQEEEERQAEFKRRREKDTLQVLMLIA